MGDASGTEINGGGGGRFVRWPSLSELLVVAVGLVWLSFVLFFALSPRPPRIPGVSMDLTSAAGHLVAFAISTGWIYLLVDRIPKPNVALVFGITTLVAVGMAVATEIAQSTLTDSRAFEWSDIQVNAAGILLTLVLLSIARFLGARSSRIAISILAASLVSAATVLAVAAKWNPNHPYPGDHWHVQYIVVICGEIYPPFQAFPGEFHTHGDRLIHIHPESDEFSGANASMGKFFELAGGGLTENSISHPYWDTYKNGDECGDGTVGKLSVHRFDVDSLQRLDEVRDFATYVPRNLETLLFEFGSEPLEITSVYQ